MIRCISSITAALAALLIANGVQAAPASGPVDKGFDLRISDRNAKPKKKKKAAEEEAAEEAEAEEEEKPKKKGKAKGKKGKKEEPPPDEEEAEEEEKPKKKGKGKKGKKEEPPPEEEEVDVKDTESPAASPEEEEELPEEAPAEEAPAGEESEEEGEKAEASAAVSTDDAAGKLFIGARLGFGLFLGNATGDENPLIDFSNKIPIWLDLGYRITPSLLVGVYGQIAPSTMKCPDQFFCSGATVYRFGAQVQYGFSPEASFAPWAGLGIGYELVSGTLKTGGVEGSFSIKGVEFLNLQAGGDFMLSKAVGIGPFLSFSLGRYSSADVEIQGITDSGGIAKKEFHEWLVLGVRGAFSL